MFFCALWLEGEFNACFEWLTRLKQWYSTHDIVVQGEGLDASDAAAESKKLYMQETWSHVRCTVPVSLGCTRKAY